MTAIKFCKFHGFGNDYIVIENADLGDSVSLPELAQTICHRNTGAGADGVAVLEKLDGADADYVCEIINPDGSVAGFSGNGTRCAAAYLYYNGLWTDKNLRLQTHSGVKKFRLIEERANEEYWFEAEIGRPKFASRDIPMITEQPLDSVIDQQLTTNNEQITFSAVNVGNPVACVFVDDFDLDWRAIGSSIETHAIFPERTNVVFVKIIDRENIDIRIWERGAGETAASGTCSAGAEVLSAYQQKTGRKVNVHSPGGTTAVLWRDDDEIVLTGSADLAYCGEWPA